MSVPGLHALPPVGRIGRYDLLGRLATGGMAEIYLARETGPRGAGRELVVKRLLPQIARDPGLIEMFANEARVCMRLRHPHICPIFEFGEQGGQHYLAMEWVHGMPLSSLIRPRDSGDRLPIPVAARVIADVASALQHAHTATDERGAPLGIVHRDVTPENIVVGFDGRVKLLDFGIAKARTQLDKTQHGVLKGKFAYMSPEQYRGEDLDARADVFSLGVCLYEVLTGQPLFARDSEFETVAAIVLEGPAASARSVRPDLPEELDRIVRKALAKDRAERWATAEDVQHALEDWLVSERRIVRERDIASLLQRLFPEETARGPELDRTTVSFGGDGSNPEMSFTEQADLQAELDAIEGELSTRGRRKRVAVGIVAALVVLLTVGVVGLMALRDPPGAVPSSGSPAIPAPAAEGPGGSP